MGVSQSHNNLFLPVIRDILTVQSSPLFGDTFSLVGGLVDVSLLCENNVEMCSVAGGIK